MTEYIAQGLGIIGFICAILAFQSKKNSGLFLFQAMGCFSFFLQFLLLGVYSAALLNISCFVRGILFRKSDKSPWKLIVVEALMFVSVTSSVLFFATGTLQILLSLMTGISLIIGSFVMWLGSGKNIRYIHLFFVSPVWLIHNFINFSLGGILCEVFNMTSAIVSFIRFGKDGFEK